MTDLTRLYCEAAEAPHAIERQLARNAASMRTLGAQLRKQPPRAVVTCARGSSDHAATFAKYLIETRAGVLTSSAAPSVSSVYAAQPDLHGALFMAISQSGKSPDLLASAQRAKAAGANVVALVNAEDSPLANMADHVIALSAGAETSVAATKSYLTALAAIMHLVAMWTDDRDLGVALHESPALLRRAWQMDWTQAVEHLNLVAHMYVVGRGLGLGIAQEAALKLKETCGIHAEAISSAEIWHGPIALVRERFPVLIFTQNDPTRSGTDELTGALAERGADILLAGSSHPRATVLPTLAAHPVIQPMLMTQSFYAMANALALARGLDPDRPPYLKKVTETT